MYSARCAARPCATAGTAALIVGVIAAMLLGPVSSASALISPLLPGAKTDGSGTAASSGSLITNLKGEVHFKMNSTGNGGSVTNTYFSFNERWIWVDPPVNSSWKVRCESPNVYAGGSPISGYDLRLRCGVRRESYSFGGYIYLTCDMDWLVRQYRSSADPGKIMISQVPPKYYCGSDFTNLTVNGTVRVTL